MSDAIEKSSNNIDAYNNIGFQMAGALQIRLSTKELLNDIYFHLSGTSVKSEIDDKGRPVSKLVVDSEPIANELGIRRIMNHIRGIINPQVVQGNFDDERYGNYLKNHRMALVQNLLLNITRYGIHADDINGLMDHIFSMIEPFLSRTLGNKERESFAQTIKSVESNTNQFKAGGGLGSTVPSWVMGGRT